MKFFICTAKNITENKKRNSGRMFPSQNWIKWYYYFLEGMKEIGKVSSRSFYYYYLLLYPFFVYVFNWRPTPSSHQSKSWSPNSWPNFSMSPECCYFSSHGSFQISKQL
jgi:hypothetical protein